MRRETFRFVAALALAVALAGPVAPARAAGGDSRGGSPWSWAGLWSWLTTAATASGCDRGSQIDPNGGCVTAAAASGCDRGSYIDADGRCATAATKPDHGIHIHPHG